MLRLVKILMVCFLRLFMTLTYIQLFFRFVIVVALVFFNLLVIISLVKMEVFLRVNATLPLISLLVPWVVKDYQVLKLRSFLIYCSYHVVMFSRIWSLKSLFMPKRRKRFEATFIRSDFKSILFLSLVRRWSLCHLL